MKSTQTRFFAESSIFRTYISSKRSFKPHLDNVISTSINWNDESVRTVSQWAKAVFPSGSETLLRPRNDAQVVSDLEPNATRRQREFAEGRACAQTLLKHWNVTEKVGVGEDRAPIWPVGFTGSISHTDHWIWSAVTKSDQNPSLGIDTEIVVDENTRKTLYDDILTEQERMVVQSLGFDPELTFTLAFSAKESFYKCWYPITREFFGFRQAAIESCTETSVRIVSLVSNPNFKLTPNWLDVHYLVTDQDVFTATWMER